MYGQLVSGNYFSALGLTPAAGRFFRQDEDERSRQRAGRGDLAWVWHARFKAAADGDRTDPARQRSRPGDRRRRAAEHFQGTVLGLEFAMWVPATLAPTLLAGSRELDSREGPRLRGAWDGWRPV